MTLISQVLPKETGGLRDPLLKMAQSRAEPGRSALPVSSVRLGAVLLAFVSRDSRGAKWPIPIPIDEVGLTATRTQLSLWPPPYNTVLHSTTHLLANMLAVHRLRPLTFHSHPRLVSRSMASKPPLGRPAPHPLPPAQQREFEALQRQAEVAAVANAPAGRAERHPDAPVPLNADFDGDVNPATGERGGPKREPVRRWIEHEGDWSFKGRVSDF